MTTFPRRYDRPEPKPTKGSTREGLRMKRRLRANHVRTEKGKARRQQGDRCRLAARCEYQREYRIEGAHLDDLGMGGNPAGDRSRADRLVRACFMHHQGPRSLHSKHLRVECLTDAGTNGPIRVWERKDVTREDWFIRLTERSVGVLERGANDENRFAR